MISAWRKRRGPVRLAILGGSILALVLVSTGILAVFFPTKALAAQSTLTIFGGLVEVRQAGGAYAPAADGQLIEAGVTVRTGADGNAVLTYFDGSTVTLEPGTELALEELTSKGADVVIVMRQVVGSTWHVVARALTPGSKYELRTPAGTASVRGTAFTTVVNAAGELELETVEGTVAATPPTSIGAPPVAPVLVTAGQVTSSTPSTPPTAPRTAPDPPAVVRVALDAGASTTAVAVDPAGRSVGVQNGSAVRYAPGSTVEVVDGRLVLSIPQRQPGRISTIVRPPDAAPGAPPVTVNIQTQVIAGGNVVANTFEQRAVDDSGSARGGIVTTSAGVIVLPDAAAREMVAPNLGKAPPPPTGQFQLFAPPPPAPPQLLPGLPPGAAPQGGPGAPPPGAPGGPAGPGAPGGAPAVPGAGGPTQTFFGGFQGFQVLGAAPAGGGIAQFSGPGATPPAGGAPAGPPPGFVQFIGALPAGFVPPPPPGKSSGCGAFSGPGCVEPPAGGPPGAPGFPGGAPPPGAPGVPGGAPPPGAPGVPGGAPPPGFPGGALPPGAPGVPAGAPPPVGAPAAFDPSSFLPAGFTFPATQGPNPFADFRGTPAPGGAPPQGAPGFPAGAPPAGVAPGTPGLPLGGAALPPGCSAGIFGISCNGVAAPPQLPPAGAPALPGSVPGTPGLPAAPGAPGFPPGGAPAGAPAGAPGVPPAGAPGVPPGAGQPGFVPPAGAPAFPPPAGVPGLPPPAGAPPAGAPGFPPPAGVPSVPPPAGVPSVPPPGGVPAVPPPGGIAPILTPPPGGITPVPPPGGIAPILTPPPVIAPILTPPPTTTPP